MIININNIINIIYVNIIISNILILSMDIGL